MMSRLRIALKTAGRLAIFVFGDPILLLNHRRRATDRPPVLYVRLDAIGDFVLGLRLAQLWTTQHPGPVVAVVGTEVERLAMQTGLFSQVIGVDKWRFKSSLTYRATMLRQLRELGADAVLVANHSRHLLLEDAIVRAVRPVSGALTSIGDTNNASPLERRVARTLYTQTIQIARRSHVLERDEAVASHLGAPLPAGGDCLARVASHATVPIAELKGCYVIAPGASWTGKRWPRDRFAAVVSHLVARGDGLVVITGTRAERSDARLLSGAYQRDQVHDACEQYALADLIRVIQSAALVVANDSLVAHLAALTGTPYVCIVGGGHFGQFFPYPQRYDGGNGRALHHQLPCYHCAWNCVHPRSPYGAYRCITDVSVDTVTRAIDGLLDRGGASHSAGETVLDTIGT